MIWPLLDGEDAAVEGIVAIHAFFYLKYLPVLKVSHQLNKAGL
jgi:hypothetical protein